MSRTTSLPLKNILMGWAVCFSVAASWESTFRILKEHAYWGVGPTFSFMVKNIAFAVACSVLLGVLHKGLIIVAGWIDKRDFISRNFLRPEIGFAAATLLGMCLWVIRYRFPLKQSTILVQQSFVILVIILTYLGCMLVARLLQRYVLPRLAPSFLSKAILIAVFGPVAIVSAIQFARDFKYQAAQPPKNAVNHIILISVDTLRWDHVSAYTARHVRTPVIDQLAAEGALFEYAISLMPETGPSHMSMLTGLSPLEHGVLKNGFVLPTNTATLATHLRKSGFETAAFVSGFPLWATNSGLDRGFRTYHDEFGWIDHFDGNYCGRFIKSLPFVTYDLSRDAKPVTDLVMKWLSKNIDEPFFLFLHYYDPHHPYGGVLPSRNRISAKPARDDLPRQVRLYAAEAEQVDAETGRIVALLKEKGIYDNTLIIFTADHGESHGEHQYFYQKENLYEDVIRVPLIIRYPPAIKPGAIVSNQVALTDIFRTILNATKVKSTQAPNSFDLFDVLNGNGDHSARIIVSNCFYSRKIKHSARTSAWKLIRNDNAQPSYELYHLPTDPTESLNVYTQNIEIARQLESFINRQLELRVSTKVLDLSPEQIESLKSLGYIQ